MEIIHRHIIHYACGCTTTRLEVQHAPDECAPICAGHHLPANKEELIVEFDTARFPEDAFSGVEALE